MAERSVKHNGLALREADGFELWFRARHAGAHFRRGVDLAGALSRPLAGVTSGYDAVQGPGEFAGAMERSRNALAYFRARTNANGPRPCHGVQDAQV